MKLKFFHILPPFYRRYSLNMQPKIVIIIKFLNNVMRKPVFALCKQQRRRSPCAPCSCYVLNFKTVASLCGCAGRFVSYLVATPEDRFSRDEAQIIGPYHEKTCLQKYATRYVSNRTIYGVNNKDADRRWHFS